MTGPLLSVFMPTYNGALYVREAVESVIHNGFPDFELVVLDDGSTDETVRIVEAIRHPAVRLLRNPANLGVVETRRRAVPLLRGRYVAMLDQDDIAISGRFDAQVQRLEMADGPDIIGGAIENFGDMDGMKAYYTSHAEVCASLLFNTSILISAACMKLSPLQNGTINYSIEAGPAADYALWVDAMLSGLRLENLATVVTRYRRHAASMTRTGLPEMLACAMKVRERVANAYFPSFEAGERAALVGALSGWFATMQRWRDGVCALAHASIQAAEIPGIDTALMARLLSGRALRFIERAVTDGVVDYDLLEEMSERNPYFEQWRAMAGGEFDRQIMALFSRPDHF